MELFRFWALVADTLLQDAQRWMNLRGAFVALLVWLVVFHFRLKRHGKLRILDQFIECIPSLAVTLIGATAILIFFFIFYYPSVVYSDLNQETQRIESERIRLERTLSERPMFRPRYPR